MTTVLIEVYTAFLEAGASEEKSQAAAKAISDYENRFFKIEAELQVIKWMLTTGLIALASIVAGTVATILKLYH